MRLPIKKIAVLGVVLIVFLIIAYKGLTSDFLLKQLHKDKLWAHRVNSIEKLQEVNSTYAGVELDVVFKPALGVFDVNHPPAESIGLTLFEFLKSNTQNDLSFWLDFKNLSQANASQALKRIEFLCTEFAIPKKQFIVEATQPELLKQFAKNGFQTSYYLHWPGLYQLKKEDLYKVLVYINANIFPELTYISSSYHDFEIINLYFPNKEKLIWLTENETKYSSPIQEHWYRVQLVNHPKVKVLLVQIKTRASNR